MGHWVDQFWKGQMTAFAPTYRDRDRRRGTYNAYVPGSLSEASLTLSATTQLLAAQAEARVNHLNASPDVAAAGQFLLRSEAITSSRIEGITPTAHNVVLAELGRHERVKGVTPEAHDTVRHIMLLKGATTRLARTPLVTMADLLELHDGLMPTSPDHHGLRLTQSWRGGTSRNPLDARFVSPPPELVPELTEDLLSYLNGAVHAPLIQAALVHAQFETLQPFVVDNSRVGRMLIQMVLARRGLLTGAALPMSLVMETMRYRYVEELYPTYEPGQAEETGTEDLGAGHEKWIILFLTLVILACDEAKRIAAEIADIRADWEERLQHWSEQNNDNRALREGSAASRILPDLPGTPMLTIGTAAKTYGVTRTAAARGLETLVTAGILTTEKVGSRLRAYTAPSVVKAITWVDSRLERKLAAARLPAPARLGPETYHGVDRASRMPQGQRKSMTTS